MAEASTPTRTASCTACREPIHPEAAVCHHCGATQHPSAWRTVSDVLKWTGGVVTVISLVVGTITLAGYYSDWREKRTVVAELIGASEWLIRTRYYQQAWEAYEEALALQPGSTRVRDGQFELAQIWLRDFRADEQSADRLLTDIGAVLYRGLPDSTPRQAATILAHMGWVQVRRVQRELPVRGDVDLLFREALEHDADNPYANAMCGYWLLMRYGPRDADTVREQELRFDRALGDPATREFVRELQLVAFQEHARGREGEKDRAALGALLRAARSMQQNGEPRPEVRILDDINRAYGAAGSAGNVEASLDALPPADHLAVHRWLFDGGDYHPVGGGYGAQVKYVRARLLEADGDRDAALASYRELLDADDARAPLAARVDAAIERLTGSLPGRALARTYRDDPVDAADPWAFHVDTLRHFDATVRPPNLDQAIAFFSAAVARGDARLPELAQLLPTVVASVRERVREGEEIDRVDAWTTGFSIWHYESAVGNLVALVVLHAELLQATGENDRAVATLSDLDRRVAKLDDDWSPVKAYVSYALARALAARADAAAGDDAKEAKDAELALDHLDAAIQGGVVESGAASWEDIKGSAFASLRGEPAYQELIRGR